MAAQLIPLPPDELPGSQPAASSPAAKKSADPASSESKTVPGSIATVSVQGVSVSGSLTVANGRASIGNDGTITAGDQSADVALTRGGDLKLCASTKIHLTTDTSVSGSRPGGPLMIALDRGALEAHYTAGQYSDVLLTPDLRILISPPGAANLSIRVAGNGDTCIDNHGDHAPYVLASSLFGEGAYRVQPNQRVLFEHGSLSEVVDNEQEPCGCPPAHPTSVAAAGATGGTVAKPGEAVAEKPPEKQGETAAQNPFPLAESEGLKPPPSPANAPATPAGQPHIEVTAPLAYDASHPELPPAPPAETAPANAPMPVPTSAIHVAQAPPPPPAKPKPTGFFGHIGHFFKRMFGG
ncbi:MAG: hypothetical protein WA294_08040 [Acidobacteriaceae bacterium]